MELSLLPLTAAARLTAHPPDQGLTAELVVKKTNAKEARQLLWFACGHCRWSAQPKLMEWWRQSKSLVAREHQDVAEGSAPATASPSLARTDGVGQVGVGDVCDLQDEDPEIVNVEHKVFTFDGLRSHLRSKCVLTIAECKI